MKRKRKPGIVGKAIPNAEEVAKAISYEWKDCGTFVPADEVPKALERGRTIGRLEALTATLARGEMDEDSETLVDHRDCGLIVPILRVELLRLRRGGA